MAITTLASHANQVANDPCRQADRPRHAPPIKLEQDGMRVRSRTVRLTSSVSGTAVGSQIPRTAVQETSLRRDALVRSYRIARTWSHVSRGVRGGDLVDVPRGPDPAPSTVEMTNHERRSRTMGINAKARER